jgi:hypothetical protein
MGLNRGVDPTLLAAISGGAFHPVQLVRVAFPGDVVRVHSGRGSLSWGGQSWLGVGEKGFIQLPAESAGAASFSGVLRLGGLPDTLDDYLNTSINGIEVDVWFGAVTARAGVTLIGSPVLVFAGFCDGVSDQQTFDGDGNSLRVLSIGITSGPSQRAAVGVYHSYEDQRSSHADDTGGRWLKAMAALSAAEAPRW